MSLVKTIDSLKVMKDLIKDGKWVRNDVGMSKVQYVKLTYLDEELMLLIASNVLEKPIYTSVERILVVNEEIIAFYDAQYPETLEEDEYENYSDFISKKEWNILFAEDSGDKIESFSLVNKTEGFYIQPHKNIEHYMRNGYDEEATEEIEKYFNL